VRCELRWNRAEGRRSVPEHNDQSLASDRMTSLVLLIGAPRSGTTWLQRILAAHAAIVSPPETELFTRYLAPGVEAFERSLQRDDGGPTPRRLKGLATVLTRDEFDDWARELVVRTLGGALAAKPTASVVLEKTPGHTHQFDVIERYAPNSRYLHLVRDGRDVAASLVAAGRGWGYRWAPTAVGPAAEMWRDHVRAGQAAVHAAGERGLEVRYEDLHGPDGPQTVRSALAHCGVSVTLAEAAELLDRQRLGRDRERHPPAETIRVGGSHADVHIDEPAGFVGDGGSGGWRSVWSAVERATFASRAGADLRALGYVTSDDWVGTVSPLVRSRALATKFGGRAARRVGDWAQRGRERLP
jgi:Sulfotransferase family